MSSIRIKNFGPINSGLASHENQGYIKIEKFTIFIGNQGTGKSSVTKLISTLTWIEKALYRGDIKETYVISYNRFVKEYCNYQNLKNYFRNDTEISYRGEIYNFEFKNNKFEVVKHPNNNPDFATYKVPKIMYVPAERNFLSAVDYPDKLKGLPKSLSTFWEEMQKSLQELSGSLILPVGNVKFEYDKSNKISRIVGSNYKIRLSEASSGFQSFVPLFLVSRNLSQSLNKEIDTSKNERSGAEQTRLKAEIEKIVNNNKLSGFLKEAALKLLSDKYRNDAFLNIVEEIEQNLFPSSQKDILFKLIEYTNDTEKSGLILTTHSPYIINYLTLSIKAFDVLSKVYKRNKADEFNDQINNIVPVKSAVDPQKAVVYEMSDDGSIKILETYKGLPSDENYLNEVLAEGNDLFAKLLEIEDLCQ